MGKAATTTETSQAVSPTPCISNIGSAPTNDPSGALGAEWRDVLRLVVGHQLRLTLIGVGIGVGAAIGLTRFLSSQLYSVKPTDLETFVTAGLVLTTVGLFASYIPARRATKVDPMVALRYE
jgi:ABC-type antimicrobial peptide transport system permease subunit